MGWTEYRPPLARGDQVTVLECWVGGSYVFSRVFKMVAPWQFSGTWDFFFLSRHSGAPCQLTPPPLQVTQKANSVHDLAETIGKKLAAAELMGAEGKVEESIKLMEEVEETRKNKAEAEQEYRNSMPASSYQQQKLRVCEVRKAPWTIYLYNWPFH